MENVKNVQTDLTVSVSLVGKELLVMKVHTFIEDTTIRKL